MARRVWVVPPTWHDEVASSHEAASGPKGPGKGRTALRRLSIRRTRVQDAGETGTDAGTGTGSGEVTNTA